MITSLPAHSQNGQSSLLYERRQEEREGIRAEERISRTRRTAEFLKITYYLDSLDLHERHYQEGSLLFSLSLLWGWLTMPVLSLLHLQVVKSCMHNSKQFHSMNTQKHYLLLPFQQKSLRLQNSNTYKILLLICNLHFSWIQTWLANWEVSWLET